MRWVALLAVTACSFERGGGGATVEPDATGAGPGVDAAAVARCTVHPTGNVNTRDPVGGDGGGGRPDLECPAGELPVGAEFTTTDQPNQIFNNERVVETVHIRCGRIERSPENKMVTIPTSRVSRDGGGTCAGPITGSGEQLCPQGAVLRGIRGNESGGSASSINSVRLECAALATDGSVTGVVTSLDFRAATGDFMNDLESSICAGGEAIVAFGGKAGCTQDQISAKCARLVCE